MEPTSFTGRARKRTTSRLVLWTDRGARLLVTFGGITTIVAVATVCLFLTLTVVPLFLPARFEPAGSVALGLPAEAPLAIRVDEYGLLGWSMRADGSVDLFRADTGKVLETRRPFEGAPPTALSLAPTGNRAVFGFADGSGRLATVGFATRFVQEADAPPALRALKAGEVAEHEGGLAARAGKDQFRVQTLRFDLEAPFDLGHGKRVVLLDLTLHGENPRMAAATADGTLLFEEAVLKTNLLTGKVTTRTIVGALALADLAARGLPDHLLLSGVGTSAYAAWKDGRCVRIDTRDVEKPVVAETVDLLGDGSRTVTSLAFLLGKTTLLVGDSGGRVRAWFTVRSAGARSSDGSALVAAHEFQGPPVAVTALAPSSRTRLMAAGWADGTAALYHVTSGRKLGEGRAGGAGPAGPLLVSPREDALTAWRGGSLHRWTVDAPHPEVTLRSIFGKVWYEGAERPEHVWQSSSGTDDFEPKFGLIPLIFGTLKATLYSMLLAVPVALLAAIHTSEFLRPEERARVKPAIELMASLPSVVLGFLSALVVAPFVEDRVPAVLAALGTVPLAVVGGAYAWQLLPGPVAARWERRRLWFAGACVPLGFALAALLGPVLERLLFAGDIRSWLDGARGTGAGGWFLLLLPACALAVSLLQERFPATRRDGAPPGRAAEAGGAAARFAVSCVAALGAAWALSTGLAALGFDPRGSFVGTYVQRNALVVGLLMGFAVIPIVYTLAEDALAAVPDHLRAASLAVGATRWQTAISVILPTAASGIFSACMIGFGRAVGETMVVLMAAGNTPILDWNVFNGFRTLSANIAVELPEAVKGGTNYRMLFLAALCLFALTFVFNTAAEIVRQRFRKRAFEL